MKVVVLLSGGLDSTVLTADLLSRGHEVQALGVHYGQRHVRELVHAWRVASELGVPYQSASLSHLGVLLPSALTRGGTGKVVPNRNAVLVAVAVGYAAGHGLDAVAVGCNADDAGDFLDCRESYLDLLSQVAEQTGVRLLYPYVGLTKAEVLAVGEALDAPVHLSRSCYENGEQPCGSCDACRDRDRAFGAVSR